VRLCDKISPTKQQRDNKATAGAKLR